MEYINKYTFEKYLEATEITTKHEDEAVGKDKEVVKEQTEELPNGTEAELPVISEEKVVKKGFGASISSFMHKLINDLLKFTGLT